MSVELTAAQAQTVAELAAREGALTLHQLGHEDSAHDALDVYATPHGTASGYRVSAGGELSQIDETLPAAD